jgi:hypothetical protein
VKPGDVIIGLASTGIHSNGLTLARDALLNKGGLAVSDHVAELGRTVGDELLEPTRIYVKAVLSMLAEPLGITALCHVTSDGFLNLQRVQAAVGFDIDSLPDPQPIFGLIQSTGGVSDEEMYQVYNMGVGFCVVCPPASAARVQELAAAAGCESWVIGKCTDDPSRTVHLRPRGLVGQNGRFLGPDQPPLRAQRIRNRTSVPKFCLRHNINCLISLSFLLSCRKPRQVGGHAHDHGTPHTQLDPARRTLLRFTHPAFCQTVSGG